MQDAPEFWISREDYLEEGVACLSKCGHVWLFELQCRYSKVNDLKISIIGVNNKE